MKQDIKTIKIWYSIQNGGDGSAYLGYFFNEFAAQHDQDDMDQPWGETCIGSIDTYEGSDTHKEMINEMSDLLLMRETRASKSNYITTHVIDNIQRFERLLMVVLTNPQAYNAELVDAFKAHQLNPDFMMRAKKKKMKNTKQMSEMVVAFSGRLAAYSRWDAQELVKEKGAEVTHYVDYKTTHLVAGNKCGHKMIQAKNLGVIIITEDEFCQLVK